MLQASEVLIIADDLSGAAEAAIELGPGTRVAIGESVSHVRQGGATVLDLETRSMSPEQASDVTYKALAGVAVPIVKKVDSQLRGNLAAEVRAARRAVRPELTTVVALALPDLHRTTRRGVVHLAGVPLHETDAWRVEARPTPRSVGEALGEPSAVNVMRDEFGGDLTLLIERHRGGVLVCDAESQDDLSRIAAAALAVEPVLLVGTAALCRAVADLLPRPQFDSPSSGGSSRPCLTIVGTAAPMALAQVGELVGATNARQLSIPTHVLATAGHSEYELLSRELAQALAVGDAVVSLVSGEGVSASGRAMTQALAAIAKAGLGRHGGGVDLILTGGETAHAVLMALDIHELIVQAEVHPGAVVSRAMCGLVATRPGSFGDIESLLSIRNHLRRPSHNF